MRRFNIVDLFAGTGTMGLAALSTKALETNGRIVWAAESNPQYVRTISHNYETYAACIGSAAQIPKVLVPVDLSERTSIGVARAIRKRVKRVDLMLAGPPCQGFSLANRLSRSKENPLNRLSLRVLKFVEAMEPGILILENVPGIRTLKTSAARDESIIEILRQRLERKGYGSVVLLLNALDYGVPQARLRSFLVAVKNQSVSEKDMTPTPTHGTGRKFDYVTVEQAIGDLPRTGNGNCAFEMKYRKDPDCPFQHEMRRFSNGIVTDHVTSRHSADVLKRYALVPEGGNWRSIRRMLATYSNPERTHQNIYQRLSRKRPARTIGHFRKAMTIHPSQDRGLSLREAARLQSIPDWFSFADPSEGIRRGVIPGLHAYQQQIGNAVCYLLNKKLVSHVLASIRSQ